MKQNEIINNVNISNLLLDPENPRFGDEKYTLEKQNEILDYIVQQFGVDDVISSLSVNGYFTAEPLICRSSKDNKYIVIEGNRRLAACLILTGDHRADSYKTRTDHYRKIWEKNGSKNIESLPCIVKDDPSSTNVLAYLGVRHIVSTKDWDSYAKAAWINKAIKKYRISLNDIAIMIGDKQNTIKTMLESYRIAKQLEKENIFDPENSQRSGRGSINYPFSWVYTIMGYKSVREFLEIGGKTDFDENNISPIKKDKLEDAGLVFESMFGNSSVGKPPAIDDSRKLGNLSKAIADPVMLANLRDGKNVDQILEEAVSIDEFSSKVLVNVYNQLSSLSSRLIAEEGLLSKKTADGLISTSAKIVKLSKKIQEEIKKSAD